MKFYTAAILLSHIAHTFSHTIDLEMKSNVAQHVIVGYRIPNNEVDLTGEACFEKIDISRLGLQCMVRYLHKDATYSVLYKNTISALNH
jgi:hypothetical protein